MTPTEARERVAKGAAHLDQVRPGWERRIDTGTLTLHDPCGCIVGQLCNTGYMFSAGLVMLRVSEGKTAEALGFERDTWGGEPSGKLLTRAQVEAWSREQYGYLQDAWIEAIAARLHPQTEAVEAAALTSTEAAQDMYARVDKWGNPHADLPRRKDGVSAC